MAHTIAQVAIPAPLLRTFDYRIPKEFLGMVQAGVRVQVPFGRQEKIGIVVGLTNTSPFKRLRKIATVYDETQALLSPELMELILWGAKHYIAPPGEAFRAVLPGPFWKPTTRSRKVKPPKDPTGFVPKQVTYNPDQNKAIDTVWNFLDKEAPSSKDAPHVFLLHGVTGSGKTEIYLELARRLLKQDKSALLLVPEIALTPQLLGRCQSELPFPIGSYHSGMTPRQRQDVWQQCYEGKLRMVVGTRSALFLPLQDLALITVDEEHDSSFKQEDRFRYNARDLAVVRGKIENSAVLLGSATPALESLQRAQSGKYHYLTLPERASGGKLPETFFVNLGQQDDDNRDKSERSLISKKLAQALDEGLQRGEQSILFLNRRGFSPVQLCKDCGEFLQCPHCHISLTLHKHKRQLLCHYCLHEQKESPSCSYCGSVKLIWVGSGTERIEQDLSTQFPRARIARLDRDTTSVKGTLENTLAAMRKGEIDILIGTQILTKGHDYSNVTLVGVLLAETSLNFPDFRAGERTFQMITQVAGRAGRGERPGRVVVQGFQPNHYVMRYALDQDYNGFAERELRQRQELDYPPFQRLIQVVLRSTEQQHAVKAAGAAADKFRSWLGKSATLMGPAPCPIEKLRNQYRWQFILKTAHYPYVRDILLSRLDADFQNVLPSTVHMAVNVDPINML